MVGIDQRELLNMLKSCAHCGSDFESKTKKLTCSEICRTKKIQAEKAKWRTSNKQSVARSNRATTLRRRDAGKEAAYRLQRRNSKVGYLDRFVERVKVMNPQTNVDRQHLELIFGDACAVTGVPFRYARSGGSAFTNPYVPSIDRINSKLPYQVGNIQIVLSAVNFAKNAMTMDDFTQVWRDIAKSWAALTQGQY